MVNRLIGPLLLLVTTLIWGAAFLAQKLGMDHYGPFTMTVFRNILGGAFLLGFLAVRKAFAPGRPFIAAPKATLVGGVASGIVLFVAMQLQQMGLLYTMPGTSAFLTANYVLAVPVLGLFLGRRAGWSVWAGVALALGGTALICLAGSVQAGKGELLTLLCALGFAVQILVVDHYAPKVDIVAMSCVQLFTVAVVGAPFLLLPSEMAQLSWANLLAGWKALAFCGILSSGVAYTLQNVAQGRTAPALAAILMSLESVFGVLFGWLILNDLMSGRQLLGCALVFAAVVLTQVLDSGDGR